MMTPIEISRLGYRALVNELGWDGMVRFVQQFDRGEGNYTQERQRWLDDLSLDEVLAEIKQHQQAIDDER